MATSQVKQASERNALGSPQNQCSRRRFFLILYYNTFNPCNKPSNNLHIQSCSSCALVGLCQLIVVQW